MPFLLYLMSQAQYWRLLNLMQVIAIMDLINVMSYYSVNGSFT